MRELPGACEVNDPDESARDRVVYRRAGTDPFAGVVADVLDLSRLKAGAFTMNAEVNTAEDLLGATIRQFSGVPDAKRIETVIDYSRAMPPSSSR